MALNLMLQGTMSNAGKSLLAAALCRIFKQDGYRVAPFKSQNMALNSFITAAGGEMGRAQVVQAEAAGLAPDVRMNPILLKPTTDVGSQVIVNGQVVGNMRAMEYYRRKREFLPAVLDAYAGLDREYDVLVIEGAGSPAEINLKQDDFVNMGLAKLVDAPVLLIGDIDRGGVFAQLYGTIALLESDERARVKGTIINKFRGDRSIEISKAFDAPAGQFDKFDRVRVPDVLYAGMLEYDGDLHIPHRYLVNPPEITNTMSEYLVGTGVREFAISETQKFGHVTYFWNGNKSGKFSEKLETYVEIPSDVVPFEQRPWMKCAEITDRLIAELEGGAYKYYRVNFPNGDMVGHTGSLLATRCAMEALDIQLARILEVIDKLGGVALITADHGNADEMYEIDKKSGQPKVDKAGHFKAKTSHTLNPVPCIIYDNTDAREHYTVKPDTGRFGLSDVAATMENLMGYEAPAMWDESLIEVH